MLGYLYVFWLLYVLVMGFYRAYLTKRLTRTALVLASPILVTAYLVDLLANWTIASVFFWERPKRFTELVTDRLTRYRNSDDGWKGNTATWICQSLLDYFDPNGSHCYEGPAPIPK